MSAARILIVDDEPDLVELAELTLARMGLATASAGDLASAREQLKRQPFDLCLCDMRLPDGDGLDLLDWAQRQYPGMPLAILTAHGNVESAVRALKSGAFDFLSKPLDLTVLRQLVQRALQLRQDPPADGQAAVPRLLGDSPPMQRLRDLVARMARSQAPVHISGESGTGKELVARLIHQAGPRAEGPFVAVNCGAIPGELMESEFFGHKRGAFTGAVADKKGLVASAEGGTLFLDEVADLPLHMQVKLLRVIQEKRVRPVGDTQEHPVDVRVLSATHKDLAERVRAGQFREDLYYRIHVIELRVPPLRERREDIALLAGHILQRLARRQGEAVAALQADALAMLQSHAFPGNVRELENILERAVALCEDGHITPADLQLPAPVGHTATVDAATSDDTPPGIDLGGQLDRLEREAIVKALAETGGHKTAAARLLGVSFRTLRYRIKKLGIE